MHTLATLADVRTLLGHLPADHREKATWRDEAAHGARMIDVTVPLRMVQSMEGSPPSARPRLPLGRSARSTSFGRSIYRDCGKRSCQDFTFGREPMLFGLAVAMAACSPYLVSAFANPI
jgi:hypothetical protein